MKELSVSKEHARFLVSMFVTVLASQATMLVDAAVGGNLLGPDAVSAVDLVMPVYELFYALAMMLGMGGCTVAAISLGRGDMAAVRRHFAAGVVASTCVMVVLGLGILVFSNGVVRLLCGGISQIGIPMPGDTSVLIALTRNYLVAMVPYFVIASASIVFMLFTAMAGKPGLVMWCAITQFAVNITCNLLMIKTMGLGIEALAYSSALASFVTLTLLFPYYFSSDCPFRVIRDSFSDSFSGFWNALGRNVRYGSGFIAVDMAYAVMAYAMNVLVLKFEGKQGHFLWSVVMMIYLTGDYASSAAQETSLSLGGRLLGAGDRVGFRMVYNRSLVFALGWIGLILAGVFVLPEVFLPMFGVTGNAGAIGTTNIADYPAVLRAVAEAIPFIAGVSIGNLFLVRLVQQGKVALYAVLSWVLYMAVPLTFLFVFV